MSKSCLECYYRRLSRDSPHCSACDASGSGFSFDTHSVNYIDVDKNSEDAGEAGVKSVPTIILPDGSRFGVSLPSDILKACSKL